LDDCIFCRIANGEIPSDKLYEDDQLVAFRDINPQAPVHVLIVPKRHIQSVNGLKDGDAKLLGHMFETARNIATALGVSGSGYRIVVNTGENGGQTVPHLHFHLLGGRALGWPPG